MRTGRDWRGVATSQEMPRTDSQHQRPGAQGGAPSALRESMAQTPTFLSTRLDECKQPLNRLPTSELDHRHVHQERFVSPPQVTVHGWPCLLPAATLTCQRTQPVHLGALQQGEPRAGEGDRGGQGGVEEGGRERSSCGRKHRRSLWGPVCRRLSLGRSPVPGAWSSAHPDPLMLMGTWAGGPLNQGQLHGIREQPGQESLHDRPPPIPTAHPWMNSLPPPFFSPIRLWEVVLERKGDRDRQRQRWRERQRR